MRCAEQKRVYFNRLCLLYMYVCLKFGDMVSCSLVWEWKEEIEGHMVLLFQLIFILLQWAIISMSDLKWRLQYLVFLRLCDKDLWALFVIWNCESWFFSWTKDFNYVCYAWMLQKNHWKLKGMRHIKIVCKEKDSHRWHAAWIFH